MDIWVNISRDRPTKPPGRMTNIEFDSKGSTRKENDGPNPTPKTNQPEHGAKSSEQKTLKTSVRKAAAIELDLI